jgi:serine phosphatase RsbU (regulator of sigma subunit)
MFEAIDPIEHRVGLGPGDSLVFYTDGVIEARNAAGEFLGEEGLAKVLTECTGCSAEETAERILDAVHQFRGEHMSDDVAVLVVRVPDDAGEQPLSRVAGATGIPEEDLRLPGYPHG